MIPTVKLLNAIFIENTFKIYEINLAFIKRLEKIAWYYGLGYSNMSEKMLRLAKANILACRQSRLPPLFGISILFKDQILIKNIRCEASNIILDNYISK
ncbi:MAG: hypothetical protein ACKESC_01280, partial [Candidatus Hodgkinia cicadicola]